MSFTSRINANLLAIVACCLWSTAFVGIKIGLAHTTPLQFAGIRFFIAGLMLIPFAGPPSALKATLRDHFRFIATVSVFATVLVYALFYKGISLGSASTTAIVVGGGPLFIAVLAHLLMPSDKLTLRKSVALLLGFSGILAIAIGRFGAVDTGHSGLLSVLLLVGANISGGFANILVAKGDREIAPLPLSALQLTMGGALLFLISIPFEGFDFSPKPPAYFGALFYLASISAGAMTLWFYVLQRPEVKVSEINIWKFLIPLLGSVLSWSLLDDDHPDPGQVIGMCAITSALVLMYLKVDRGRAGQVRLRL